MSTKKTIDEIIDDYQWRLDQIPTWTREKHQVMEEFIEKLNKAGYSYFHARTIKPQTYTEHSEAFTLSGSKLSWSGSVINGGGDQISVEVTATLDESGKKIMGSTTFSNGKTESWEAESYSGLPLNSIPMVQAQSSSD